MRDVELDRRVSDCSRPANNYVRVNTVDLYTPNARFTQERLGYQVLTLFGKLGYSQILGIGRNSTYEADPARGDSRYSPGPASCGLEGRTEAAFAERRFRNSRAVCIMAPAVGSGSACV